MVSAAGQDEGCRQSCYGAGRLFRSSAGEPRAWINDPKLATGGPIADVGVHCIDTLRYVLGEEVRTVTARAHYDYHWVVEASGSMVLEFDSGVLATVSVYGRSVYLTYLEIVGNKGVLSGLNALNVEHPPTLERRSGFELMERRTISNSDAYALQVDAFAAAVVDLCHALMKAAEFLYVE